MINWKDWKTYIFLLIPIITGYIASIPCKIEKESGITVPARPPSWIFGTIWPFLYLSLGTVWIILRNKDSYIIDILMCLTIVGLISWIIVYGCSKNKKNALYIILLVLVTALLLFGYSWTHNKYTGMLITPFLAWILFATMLNFTEVNNKPQI